MKIEETFELPFPPERIWPWLTEPARMPRWVEEIVSVRTRDGLPLAVGSVIELVPKGRGATIVATVVSLEPQKSLVLRVDGGLPQDMVVEIAWNLAGNAASTRLCVRAEAQLSGLMVFMESLIASQARKKLAAYAELLRKLAAED